MKAYRYAMLIVISTLALAIPASNQIPTSIYVNPSELGLTFGLNVSIPTGKNIYDDLSDNELPMGTGHYETGVHLDYQRISDPVVANFGAGVQYIWPRTHNGEQTKPGFGFTIRSGIGYHTCPR